jgi:hypothetical protein
MLVPIEWQAQHGWPLTVHDINHNMPFSQLKLICAARVGGLGPIIDTTFDLGAINTVLDAASDCICPNENAPEGVTERMM